MARRFTIEILMNLAKSIGANPSKLAGTRTNISFLGKGPDKNPLFQNRLAGLENATEANLGKPETLFGAIEDAVGWAKDGKLNGIQTEILGHNLSGINKILHPPVLPSASVTNIAPGIEGLKKKFVGLDELGFTKERARALGRFPKESHKFMGRPLKDKDFSEIDRLIMEGKIPDLKGRRWNLKAPGTGDKSRPFMGWTPKVVPKRASLESFLKQLDEKILQAEEGFLTRADLNTMSPEVLDNLRRSVDPIGMHRMFGEITKFASGGLAGILEV